MNAFDDIAVILVAAGRGSRMGGGLPKQWRPLAGRPVLAHTIEAFRRAGLTRILVAIHPEDRSLAESLGVTLVDGGATRSATVRAALESLEGQPPAKVLIHDGARPLVDPALIHGVIEALTQHDAAAPALPVTDALWRGEEGKVAGLQPRDGLFRAQTPQGFAFAPILAAHRAHPGEAADDVAVALAAGIAVQITQGSENNLKLTYPADFDRAERWLAEGQTQEGR